MAISKETQVGVLAALAITILVIGYNFLRGDNVFASSNRYFATYDKVEGLFESNPVIFKGKKIGHVSAVEFADNLDLEVWIKVGSDFEIPLNSTMKIVNNDMIGSKAVELILGDTSVFAKDGDNLVGVQDPGITEAITEVLTPLSTRLKSVLGNIDTAVQGADLETTLQDASLALKSFKETADKLNRLLDGKGEQISAILANVETTTRDLKGLSPKIDGILGEIDATTKEINKVDFAQLGTQLNGLSVELKKTTSAINNKEGSLGMLVHDKAMYNDLEATIKKLDVLAEDIKKWPSLYTGITQRQRDKAAKAKAAGEKGNVD